MTADGGIARDHDLVVLHRHTQSDSYRPEVSEDLAAVAEAGVQAAIGVVPRQGKPVITVAVGGKARDHDLVTLHRHAQSGSALPEVGEDLAAVAEPGVQAAVGVVPGQGK